ncbi:MAG: hypothetical protein H0U21_04245, partial [Acidimicrobiia bacterium]|nr:hypothetical protein [Acidimicrobiia bacterium]
MNAAPAITATTVAPLPVTGASATVTAVVHDDAGDEGLTCVWTSVPGGVVFAPLQAGARSVTATFPAGGTYAITGTVTDGDGATASATVDAVVVPSPASVLVSPASIVLATGASQPFTAAVGDQFGEEVPAPSIAWSVDQAGSIAADGVFTAGAAGVATVTATSGAVVGTATVTVSPANTAPTLGAIADRSVTAGTSTGAITIEIGDAQSAASELVVTVQASDATLLPASGLVLAGTGAVRTLTILPPSGPAGAATITVSVSDGTLSASIAFVLTVLPAPNQAPSFVKASDIDLGEDAAPVVRTGWATQIVPGGAGDVGQRLQFQVVASVPALFAEPPRIAPDGTLSFTPAPDAYGTTAVTVRLQDDGGTDDGGLDTSGPQVFTITIAPANDAPVMVSAPRATGEARIGATLSSDRGVWSDAADTGWGGASTLAYAIRWQRADGADGHGANDLAAATQERYVVTGADAGAFLRALVTVSDDGVGEPASRSAVAASPWLGPVVGDLPTVAFASPTIAIREADAPVAIIVRLSQAVPSTVVVPVAIAGAGDARFVLPDQDVTFEPGEVSKTISAAVHDDAVCQAAATVIIALGEPRGPARIGSPATSVIAISDDDVPRVAFVEALSSVTEGSGVHAVRIAVDPVGIAPITVTYALSGTATVATAVGPGVDVVHAGSTCVITAGAAQAEVLFTVEADDAAEDDESLRIDLVAADGGEIGSPAAHEVSIVDPATIAAADVAAPVFDPPGGVSLGARSVTIRPVPAYADVWYTIGIDPAYPVPGGGSGPGAAVRATGPLTISGSTTIRAVSALRGSDGTYRAGPVRTASYSVVSPDSFTLTGVGSGSSATSPASLGIVGPASSFDVSVQVLVDGRVHGSGTVRRVGTNRLEVDVPLPTSEGATVACTVRDGNGGEARFSRPLAWGVTEVGSVATLHLRRGDHVRFGAPGSAPFEIDAGIGGNRLLAAAGGSVVVGYPRAGIYTCRALVGGAIVGESTVIVYDTGIDPTEVVAAEI